MQEIKFVIEKFAPAAHVKGSLPVYNQDGSKPDIKRN
jgi:hypothetical protein